MLIFRQYEGLFDEVEARPRKVLDLIFYYRVKQGVKSGT